MISSDGKYYKTDVADTEQLFRIIQSTPSVVTISELSKELGISTRAVEKQLKNLKEKGYIKREGGRKSGLWIIS